jgi:hypothetical protein
MNTLEDADLYVTVILKWNVRYGEIGSGLLDSHLRTGLKGQLL